jgi:amidohydrolase
MYSYIIVVRYTMNFDLTEEAKKQLDYMIARRRYLHRHPCVSFHEEDARDYLATEIAALGPDTLRPCGKNGLVADLHGHTGGKTIAFRADMDALPIQEETGLPFASENPGVMHACGHDCHTAALLGLLRSMTQHRAALKYNVRFIFQYAEEPDPGGAIDMIANGCLAGVDRIYGLHVDNQLSVGTIGIKDGPYMAGSGRFDVTIRGQGGHGALPHLTTDVLGAVCHTVSAIDAIPGKLLGPGEEGIISVCYINGQSAFNVLPAEANFGGLIRAFNDETFEKIETLLRRELHGICDAYGAAFDFRYSRGYPVLVNHTDQVNTVRAAAQALHLPCRDLLHTFITEDFSRYLEKCPGAYFRLGTGNPEKGAIYPLHSSHFTVDEDALAYALMMYWQIYQNESK